MVGHLGGDGCRGDATGHSQFYLAAHMGGFDWGCLNYGFDIECQIVFVVCCFQVIKHAWKDRTRLASYNSRVHSQCIFSNVDCIICLDQAVYWSYCWRKQFISLRDGITHPDVFLYNK